jgi:DNA repair protein RecO (recombination protein O)
MSAEKALAVVLRVVDFSETSCVLTLFTREFGKVRALAKGARRPKGPFESAIDLLALCRIVFLRKSSDALDLLTEAKLERRFRVGSGDLADYYAACYVAELLGELTDDGDPHPELFDAAEQALSALSTPRPTGRVAGAGAAVPGPATASGAAATSGQAATASERHNLISRHVLRFELVALRVLGHVPSLDACVECGAEVPGGVRAAFASVKGGVLCAACRPGPRGVISVSAAAVATMRQYSDLAYEEWRERPLDRNVAGELRGLLNHYLCDVVGHELRMHRYLAGRRS